MIAAFLLYCLLASVLLAAVGVLFEYAARVLSLPARFPWMAALTLVLLLGVAAPFRQPLRAPEAVVAVADLGAVAGASADGNAEARRASGALGLGRVLDGALRWVAPMGRGRRGTVLAAVWAALSALVLGAGLAVLHRAWRRRRPWPRGVLLGETVRIAPREGPAVVGLIRPEIVVPRWLVAASRERQDMAIRHEREHLRAGDPYTLAFAGLMTALMPWNPVIWWMCGRLRLAVELDCDHRVVRGGVPARAYGSFLLDTAALGGGRLQGAVTLAPLTSTLSRRLRAMTDPKPRHPQARAALVTLLGAITLAAACESRLPTQAEIDAMDVATAEAKIRALAPAGVAREATYYVDGVEVTPEQAKGVLAERIERIEVKRGPEGESVAIVTRVGEEAAAPPAEVAERVESGGTLRRIQEGEGLVRKLQAFDGLVLIDDEVVDPAELRNLPPVAIASVEVIKGKAAQGLYAQPEAARGVIRITTKRQP